MKPEFIETLGALALGVCWLILAVLAMLPRRERNHRGHRLAKWLRFHGGIK